MRNRVCLFVFGGAKTTVGNFLLITSQPVRTQGGWLAFSIASVDIEPVFSATGTLTLSVLTEHSSRVNSQ